METAQTQLAIISIKAWEMGELEPRLRALEQQLAAERRSDA
jgi:hypothetical protein